jgi:hypothetical protein
MATYRVGFDGRWQGDFDSRERAMYWAGEVHETGRTVYVIEARMLRKKLIATFPDDPAIRKGWRGGWAGPGVDPGGGPA